MLREILGGSRTLHGDELQYLLSSSHVMRVTKWKMILIRGFHKRCAYIHRLRDFQLLSRKYGPLSQHVKPTTLKKCALCIFGSLIYHILVSASPHVREEDENQDRKLAYHFEIERMHFKNMSPIRHYLALAKAQYYLLSIGFGAQRACF